MDTQKTMGTGKEYKKVPITNFFMEKAMKLAAKSGCAKQATGAVIVKEGEIIGCGSNSSKRVEKCPREERGYKTGEGYELCREICGQEGHAEVMAIKDVLRKGFETKGSSIYLAGHWYCCDNCLEAIEKAEISDIYLEEEAEKKYKR